MPAPRLVTIPISHYGERARWALDYAGIDYVETHHLQMFSWVAAYRLGGGKTLPVLVTDTGTLADSREIVRFASELAATPLYPNDASSRREVEELERRFAGRYGVETRRDAYAWVFRDHEIAFAYNDGQAPAYQRRAVRAFWPVVERVLGRYLDVSATAVDRGRDEIQRTLDAMAERLADGRRFLMGDAFSAADLTFAAMTAPAILPHEYGVPLPPLDAIADDVATRVRAYREHPAGAFAMRLYRDHRRRA